MLYLDSSLLVPLVLTEPSSPKAKSWLSDVEDELVTSIWARVEVASALSIKQRTGTLAEGGRAIAERALGRLLDEEIEVVPVQRADFEAAERMAARPVPPLRAADALHIAVAARVGATVHTLDQAQAVASRAHGVDAVVTVPKA